MQFARTEGIIPAPESSHAIRAAIDEALQAQAGRQEKDDRVQPLRARPLRPGAYEAYLAGKLQDYEYPAEQVAAALKHLPQIKG